MPHILVAGRIHASGLALLDAAEGISYDYVEEVSEPSYAPLIGTADGLVIRTQPCTAKTITAGGRLQIVSRHGVGYDAVHIPSLNARGIALAIVGDVNSVSVAEHAMMMLMAVAKHACKADRAVRIGDWGWRNRLEAREVSGKRLLIVGFGRIGRHLARMAEGFGMEIRAHDPYLQQSGWPEGKTAPVPDLGEGMAWADAVSVHAPKGDAPLIGEREIAAMRPGAVLVNTARGGVVCEASLIRALQEARIAGAGLDVFDDEPPDPDNPLLHLTNVLLSPHIAGLTEECAKRMAISSVRNVLDFFDGRLDPALIVNNEALHASEKA